MDALVCSFNRYIHEDPRILHFFAEADRKHIERKQAWFFTTLMMRKHEGTADYMAKTHRELVLKKGLNGEHFDVMLACLEKAIIDVDLPQNHARVILTAAKALKGAVLNEAAPNGSDDK